MSGTAPVVRKYTWREFYKDAETLADMLAPQKFGSLIVVARGGMFLGGLLSQHMNLPLVETVCVQSYKGKSRGEITLLKPAIANLPRPVIVDEICDSGQTLKFLVDSYQLPTAVLFYKPKHKVHKPDYFLHETDAWVTFPWEKEPKVHSI